MNPKKILLGIVDDHQIVIDGLESLLAGDNKFEVVIECTQSTQMLELLKKKSIDILLTDVMMPEMNGAELAKEVHKHFPAIKILALSMSGDADIVNKMIDDSDISGYVLKNIGKKELLDAILKISQGGVYFSQEVLDEMQKDSQLKKDTEIINLTAREIEIVKLIEKECNNREIAETLFLSERTVETHRKNIFRKTKTSGIIGLIKFAYQHKIINK